MRCLGQVIALVLVVVFVTVLPCSMWTFNTQRIALSGDTYKEVFTDEGFYQELIPVVLPSLIDGLVDEATLPPGQVTLAQVVNHLKRADWEPIAADLVPANWVKNEVETNLDAFFGWLGGERSELVLVFHTEDVRRRLMGEPGQNAVRQIADALPLCSPDQEQQFDAFRQGAPVEFPYCRPERADLDEALRAMLVRARDEVASALPPNVDLIQEMEQGAREQAAAEGKPTPEEGFSRVELNRFRATVRLWQRLLVMVFLVPAALLSLIVIFTVRSSKSFFRWMGCPVILGSLFTLIPLVFLPLLIHDLSGQWRIDLESEMAAGGQLAGEILGQGMMRLVVGEFTLPVLQQAALLVGVGFLFLVLSVLLSDPDAPPIDYPVTYAMPSGPGLPEMPTRMDSTGSSADQTLPPDTRP